MAFALLHLFFFMNAFDLTTENSISFYRFHVNSVERCPMNASEFKKAARTRNCTGNDRYLCAPDRNLSSLIEFCTDTKRSLFEKGNCLRLEGTGGLNHYRCVERFVSGCPTGPYTDDEIYKYPACLELNLEFNCFVADKNCQKRLLTTTDKYFNDSKDGDVLKNAEPKTFDGSSKLQIVIVIVYGFLYVAILTGSVAIYIYKREKYKNGKYLDDKEYSNKQKDEDEKKLREFLRREKITVRHARGIIVGCSGAGKTTLLNRLANVNYNDLKKIKSTGFLDVHVSKFVLTKEGKMIPRKERDEDQTTIKIPADMINNRDINQSIETGIEKNDVNKEIGDDKDFSSNLLKTKQEGWSEHNKNRAGSEHNESLQNSSKQENMELQPSSDEMLLEDNETNNDEGMEGDGYETFAVSDIMDYVRAMSGTDYLGPQITFLDFAGQKMYYSYHQIYLSPGTFYILVVDMTKKLDEMVEVPETDEKGCTRFESWTYKDYYRFWLQSIDSFSDESTPVIVVGTHADKIEETVFKSFFKEFFDLFSHNVDHNLYRHLHRDRKYVIGFPTKGAEMEDLKDLKNCIAEIVNKFKHSEESIRPVWAIFEQYLLKVREDKRIISRADLLKFNEKVMKENKIHDDDITELLKFLNKAGTVLFFEEERLKDTVILDFQWFVDAFKCIINYHVDLDKPTDNKREHFQWTGELEDEELNAIWKKCSKEEKDYFKNKNEIIDYMEHLGLLAKCNSKRPNCKETPWYLVPSMNKRKFNERIIKNCFKSSILCFQFKEEQLPMHVFYSVVFQCFKIPGWSILTDENEKQICVYENMACFLFQNRIVVLCVCKSQIQVQVCDLEKGGNASSLQREIQNEVSKIIQAFEKYPSSVGYKCQNGVFNNENDTSFFSKESFSASDILCRKCKECLHKVDKKVCWIEDPLKNDSDAQTEKSSKHGGQQLTQQTVTRNLTPQQLQQLQQRQQDLIHQQKLSQQQFRMQKTNLTQQQLKQLKQQQQGRVPKVIASGLVGQLTSIPAQIQFIDEPVSVASTISTININVEDPQQKGVIEMAAHQRIANRERVPRNFRDRSNPLEDLSAADVFERYRFHPDTIMDLLRQLPDLTAPTKRNLPIPPLLQLLVTLRFLGTGATHILVGDDVKISRPTAGRCIRRVSALIANLAPHYINFPRGDQARQVMLEFAHIAGFPKVLGCVDGTHVRITKPPGPQEADFVNRKQYHSLNVQMVCDPAFKITSISNWPGATHDNRIFKMSSFCHQFEQGDHDGLLLGDSGYQCRPFLMTPFISPVDQSERRYNNALCRTRVLIEQTFGFLKKRFQCLNVLRTKPEVTVVYIKAAVTLHNFGIERGEVLETQQNAASC